MIAYYAYRPATDQENQTYAKQLENGFVNVEKTEIYVYHFDLKREFKVSGRFF